MRPWVAMKHFGIDFETIKLKLFTPEFAEQKPVVLARSCIVVLLQCGAKCQ